MLKKTKFKIKIKLPIILLILIFLTMLVSLLKIKKNDYNSLVDLNTQVVFATKISKLLHEIQLERGISIAYISNNGKIFKEQFIKQQSSTDLHYKDVITYAQKNMFLDENSHKALKFINIKSLKTIRKKVNLLELKEPEIIQFYSKVNSNLLNIVIDISKISSKNIISQNIIAYINFLYSKEFAGLERALGVNILSNNNADPLIINKFNTLISKQDLYNDFFFKYATDELKKYHENTFNTKIFRQVSQMRNIILTAPALNSINIDLTYWFEKSSEKIEHLKKVDDLLSKNILMYISNKKNEITNELVFFVTLSIVAFFIAIFMLYLLAMFIKHEEVLRSIIDKNVVSSTTDLKGVIIDASEAFCKISGFKKNELIGQPHKIVRHRDMKKETFKGMWQTIKDGNIWVGDVKNRKKGNKGYYWVTATITPIYSFGKIVAYTSTRQNITDKKEIEELNKNLEERVLFEVEKNREKDEQLAQQARLAQMGEMISMIAHQWRQPLAAISSLSLGLNLKAQLGKLNKETTLDLSNKITENSKYLSETIDDFREFFRPNKEKKEAHFVEIIESVINIVGDSITNKNINIIKEFSCDKKFLTYPNEIKQVILNLIKNAADVLIENKIENSYIKLLTYSDDDKVILEVSDNGGGIPDHIISKVFDPYFSTKTKKDGTGLGLYMSKTIIEKHCNGKLTVSNSKEGAVFKICFTLK
ncbi:MAG: nitrate- and nitrite sensing domain-containing protein [Colwellia sp.]